MAIIYKVVNKLNGKIYIGKTNASIDQRFYTHMHNVRKGSKTLFHNALRKYGKEGFDISLVEYCSEDIANTREQHYIKLYESNINGYNLTQGGDGGNTTKLMSPEKLAQWTFKQRIAHNNRSERWKTNSISKAEAEGLERNRRLWASDEERQKRSVRQSKSNNSRFKGPYYVDGVKYDCLNEIMKVFHTSGNTEDIKRRLARKGHTLTV